MSHASLGQRLQQMEFAGAFGDLGTLIPFVVGYITLNKMDPLGILVAFGLFKIFVGLYFRTPVPIQPMKAIGGMAIAHAGTITHGMIWVNGGVCIMKEAPYLLRLVDMTDLNTERDEIVTKDRLSRGLGLEGRRPRRSWILERIGLSWPFS